VADQREATALAVAVPEQADTLAFWASDTHHVIVAAVGNMFAGMSF
jgi:hypothetical protein